MASPKNKAAAPAPTSGSMLMNEPATTAETRDWPKAKSTHGRRGPTTDSAMTPRNGPTLDTAGGGRREAAEDRADPRPRRRRALARDGDRQRGHGARHELHRGHGHRVAPL